MPWEREGDLVIKLINDTGFAEQPLSLPGSSKNRAYIFFGINLYVVSKNYTNLLTLTK